MSSVDKVGLAKDQEKVDAFYNEKLKSLLNERDKNINKAKIMRASENEIKKQIEETEINIKNIKDDPDNYVNKQKELNRLKNFNLERKIYDYEKKLESLNRNLEWMRKMHDIELKYLKEKTDNIMKEYNKLSKEKEEIDKAITAGVLGLSIIKNVGGVISAKKLQEENDEIFKNIL